MQSPSDDGAESSGSSVDHPVVRASTIRLIGKWEFLEPQSRLFSYHHRNNRVLVRKSLANSGGRWLQICVASWEKFPVAGSRELQSCTTTPVVGAAPERFLTDVAFEKR
jgi:hypothetical protein